MATGIVLSIDPSGSSGQVQQDETGDVFDFSDTNFPNTGLTDKAPTNSCTFQILPLPPSPTNPATGGFYATSLAVAPAPRLQTINTSSSNDVTALVGDIITITGKTTIVSGSININGGKVIVDNGAQISPAKGGLINVTSDGIMVAKGGGQVNGTGGININTGGSMKVIKNGVVNGNIGINQGGRMIIGNQNGPGFITGTIDIQGGLRDLRVTPDSKITS